MYASSKDTLFQTVPIYYLLMISFFRWPVVKLAMHSMPEALLTSSQAKEILAKIDDESSKAEFIGNMIVWNLSFTWLNAAKWLAYIRLTLHACLTQSDHQEKIVDKANFVPEIDKLPKDIAKKLKIDLKEILAFNSNNASGRYSFDLERFADQMILKKLMLYLLLRTACYLW